MRPSKARYVTLCQQLLAVGVVIAMLGPAADVISLDVVVHPGAEVRQASAEPERARVATEAVEPEVIEVPLEVGPPDAPVSEEPSSEAGKPHARRAPGATEFVTEPAQVDGLATVGVTWEQGQVLEEDQISVMARTRTDGAWSDWTELEYHDEHQPDPDSPEGRLARPGTEPLVVGEVDEVQTKVVTQRGVQADELSMAVVQPGTGETAEQAPEIETGSVEGEPGPTSLESSEGDIALSASSYTRKPRIYSRAQWGADESLRDRSSLRYFEVHAGFVHHTVNSNSYTADQVPGIIRGIYAYHTRSRGWSDIGYNFLVDRFGRVWEGRYGGVDRPVVGAHTLGYNDYAFAASAIGNFETVRPSDAMVRAYGELMAWKLSLHGVRADAVSQRVGSGSFPAINGHRDAGSTACPGRYLYARIPEMRDIASQIQADWSGRDRETAIVGSAPDMVLRRGSDGAAFVVPTGGMLGFRAPLRSGRGWTRYDLVLATPDVTGDGQPDLLVRNGSTGRAGVRAGKGEGRFAGVPFTTRLFAGFEQVTAAGDIDGDGRNDLVGRSSSDGALYLFRGNGAGNFSRVLLRSSWPYNLTAATGDLDGDGNDDVLARDPQGRLWLHHGSGRGALGDVTQLRGTWWGAYKEITGFGDFTADGIPDVIVRNAHDRAYVFPGNGRGDFFHWQGPYTAIRTMTSLSAVNVAGTGDPDVVGLSGDQLAVVRHNGRQNVLPPVWTGANLADANLMLNVGDWDRDGVSDVVTRSAAGDLWLHRGLADGRLQGRVQIASGFGAVRMLAAVGDVTGDGFPDLMGQPGTSAMRIYPGTGGHSLGKSYVARSALAAQQQLGLGRWDGDGAPDSAFVHQGSLSWLRGNGPGGLTGERRSIAANLSRYDLIMSVGNVDRRRGPDLIVRQRGTTNLWLLPSSASGFGPRRFLSSGFYGYDLAG